MRTSLRKKKSSPDGLHPLLRALFAVLAVLFWVLVWWILAVRIGKPLLLPTPWSVLRRLAELAVTAEFLKITLLSLGRILGGIVLSVLIGIPLGVLTAKLHFFSVLLRPLMTAIRATPVAAFIILIWLWIGKDEVPTIITVLIGLPVVWQNVETGVREIPKPLVEMARVFRVPFFRRILAVDLPAVLPTFHASLQTAVGLGWKAGVAAEILVRPVYAIGREISDANYNLESVDLFAWTLTVVLLSLVIEWVLSALLARLFRSVTPTAGTSVGKEASE